MRPRHMDLFSGIGGFALAGRWAGFETVQFVEIEDFPQRVLRKNFPGVPIHGDIRTFNATSFVGRIGVVTGGFPCQDISAAGKGAGIDGERSGLWSEMLRVVRECRPMFMLAENSPFLRTRGIDRVLGDLEAIGYAGWPVVVGAGSAGAPHLRSRAFVLAHATGLRCDALWTESATRYRDAGAEGGAYGRVDSDGARIGRDEEPTSCLAVGGAGEARTDVGPHLPWRVCEPPVPGVANGLPRRVDRVRALGNAVVPQVAYPFLRAIYAQIEGMK